MYWTKTLNKKSDQMYTSRKNTKAVSKYLPLICTCMKHSIKMKLRYTILTV